MSVSVINLSSIFGLRKLEHLKGLQSLFSAALVGGGVTCVHWCLQEGAREDMWALGRCYVFLVLLSTHFPAIIA